MSVGIFDAFFGQDTRQLYLVWIELRRDASSVFRRLSIGEDVHDVSGLRDDQFEYRAPTGIGFKQLAVVRRRVFRDDAAVRRDTELLGQRSSGINRWVSCSYAA